MTLKFGTLANSQPFECHFHCAIHPWMKNAVIIDPQHYISDATRTTGPTILPPEQFAIERAQAAEKEYETSVRIAARHVVPAFS